MDKKIKEGPNFTATCIGKLQEIPQHSLQHPKTGKIVQGKVFLKELTASSGTEISFNSIPPRTEVPYFHIHRKNEETYLILQGSGYFQVDDQWFPISEGSVIRVAPAGKRGLTNTSDQAMVYLVVQSREGSLEEYSSGDGERMVADRLWPEK